MSILTNSRRSGARTTAAAFARRYRDLGLVTIRLAPGFKFPNYSGWTDTKTPPEHWLLNPHDGIAMRLAPSGVVSLDVDDEARAEVVLRHLGVELAELKSQAPCAIGRNPKVFFRAPDIALKHRTLTWPKPNNERGNIVLFEFRAGNIPDTLPPTIHPRTGKPYRWLTPPRSGFPPLPQALLALWLDFDAFKHRARNLCPWADPEPEPQLMIARTVRPRIGPSVIAEFNAAHDAAAILEQHGYQRIGKRRWKSPNGHGMAGLVMLPDGKVFCHHQSDVLGDGKPHDAFDLYRVLDHGGDFRRAVKAAAEAHVMTNRS